ncbi:MAG: preprotein translocase subunit SecA [Pseudomonadota bacterium]|jgi:preprotein translocase subunit SecA
MLMTKIAQKVFGSRNSRLLKHFRKWVMEINAWEPSMQTLSDEALKNKTTEFKQRLVDGTTLDAILPEAFAVVRETARRVLGMRHFDVQLIGGMVLHQGKIAEMRTGEGKTLMSTLAAYLNALSGKPVHLVTINDYLAQRDAEWMGPIYDFLGLRVGVIANGMDLKDKQQAYLADITYGTNNEFGFDYLRDNMAFSPTERMQRGLGFAIVDEVDSILIDEARTPLIISGAAQESSALYIKLNDLIPRLKKQVEKEGPGDYAVDAKAKQAFLTEAGHQKVEGLLVEAGLLEPGESLYDANNIMLMHHLYAGLKAHALFKRDVDYIVSQGQIVIVDEHTGRTMQGRRWSDGLHQAVEAKEKVEIQSENQTLASITFQNYFRLYDKLSGMTGTADTEAYELHQIYGLEVVVIPTNQPGRRADLGDLIYLTQADKFKAIIEDIRACVARKQPVLVGTISIETSEYLSGLLDKEHIPHKVLNAKQHEQEAEIIAEAGRPAAVTIATNMAGRGTDIVLGGSKTEETNLDEWKARHEQVVAAGGLHVIGTERHESRRIDNQLRGRSGRQGDPGSTRFYLSIDDHLMRIFISDRISGLLSRLGMESGEAITHPWVTRAVENAQRKVEGYNFDIRKQLLEYDDVANEQRQLIYQQRNDIMDVEQISSAIAAMRADVVQALLNEHIPPNSFEEQWNIEALENTLAQEYHMTLPIKAWIEDATELDASHLQEKIRQALEAGYQAKVDAIGVPTQQFLEKTIMLNVLDSHWKEHLATMDYMRQSIHLRGYAQKDPKQEYKREAFHLFSAMLEAIKQEVVTLLFRVDIKPEADMAAIEQQHQIPQNLAFNHPAATNLLSDESSTNSIGDMAGKGMLQPKNIQISAPGPLDLPKVGRNEPCPCQSGKKYKYCHGKLV